MIVTTEPHTQPYNAHESDFDFMRQLLAELEKLPSKEKVHFPLPNRSAVFADVECTLGYNSDDKPYGELFFVTRKHEMEMAHSVVVTYVMHNGVLQYGVQIKPNSRLRHRGHRSWGGIHGDAKAAVKAIRDNYFPGAAGRKVIATVKKEEFA